MTRYPESRTRILVVATLVLVAQVAIAPDIAHSAGVGSQSASRSTDEKLGTGFLFSVLQNARNAVPDSKYKCVLDTYGKIVAPQLYADIKDLGADNKGIVVHLQNLFDKYPCFRERAVGFWTQLPGYVKSKAPEALPGEVSTFAAEAGQGKLKDLPPGWLWQKAMDSMDQNPKLAMELLSVCTTTLAKPTYYKDLSEEKVRRNIALAQKTQGEIEAKMKNLDPKSPEYAMLEMEKSSNEAVLQYYESTGGKSQIDCVTPQVFAAKSLSPDVDISDDLKREISRTQGREFKTISAKSYHLYTGAMMGCELSSKCGLTADEAALVEKTAGSAYRSIRLCETARQHLISKDLMEELLDRPYDKSQGIKAGLLKFTEKTGSCEKALGRLDSRSAKEVSAIGKFCEAVERIAALPQNKRAARIDRWLTEMDSAVLYNRWYLGGGSVAGINIPCTDVRLGGPDDLKGSDAYAERPKVLGPALYASECKIPGWSRERCDAARAKLATWDIDFRWTKTQHEVGARFGATQCGSKAPTVSIDKLTCPSGSGTQPAARASGPSGVR